MISKWRKFFGLTDETGAPITSSNPLNVDIGSSPVTSAPDFTISTNNSTSTPLGISGSFTGTSDQPKGFGIAYVNVYSDVASATDGLSIEQSSDGTNWDHQDHFTIPAATGKNFSINLFAQYFRVVYTNGTSAQTDFRLQVIFKPNGKPSSHRIQDAISSDDDAELQKSVITGIDDSGTFINGSFTRNGNFKVSQEAFGDTPSIDPFGRLRIAEPFTIFDSKQLHDKQPLFWDESLGGSATSTHNSTDANVEMTVTASSSDFVIRQTKQRFNYQPGKGQLIFMTFQSTHTLGLTKRIGVFDGTGTNNLTPNNGIWFSTDGDVTWNIAKNGTTAETALQANWNVDKLDGTGASGITIDFDDTQILVIDYEWLGVGRVRVGFVIDGLVYYCHYFNHANNNFSSVYMSTPNLPLRYDIQSDGTAGGTLDHICSTIISEGGQQKTGILRSADTGSTHVDANSQNTIYAVVGIRLKTTYKDVTIIPESLSMINENNDDFRWSLCLNPTIAGTFTYTDIVNSAVQKATGATANTVSDEGTVIVSGYASIDTLSASESLNTALRIGTTIGGTADELVLCVTPLSNGADIQAALNFRELL